MCMNTQMHMPSGHFFFSLCVELIWGSGLYVEEIPPCSTFCSYFSLLQPPQYLSYLHMSVHFLLPHARISSAPLHWLCQSYVMALLCVFHYDHDCRMYSWTLVLWAQGNLCYNVTKCVNLLVFTVKIRWVLGLIHVIFSCSSVRMLRLQVEGCLSPVWPVAIWCQWAGWLIVWVGMHHAFIVNVHRSVC